MDGDKSIPVTLCPSPASTTLNDPVPQPISKMVMFVCGSHVLRNAVQVSRITESRKPWSGSLSNVDAKSSQYCCDFFNRFSWFSVLCLFIRLCADHSDELPNGWRLSCERLLAGRKEPCSVQRRSTAQRTNERFPPAALGSFKRWLGGAASHAAVDQPDRPRNARRGPPDLRKPAQALGLRQSARGVGPRARAAGTRRAGCGRRRCGGRSCRARRRDSRRRCVPRRWHR